MPNVFLGFMWRNVKGHIL